MRSQTQTHLSRQQNDESWRPLPTHSFLLALRYIEEQQNKTHPLVCVLSNQQPLHSLLVYDKYITLAFYPPAALFPASIGFCYALGREHAGSLHRFWMIELLIFFPMSVDVSCFAKTRINAASNDHQEKGKIMVKHRNARYNTMKQF